MNNNLEDGFQIRQADTDDIPVLVSHHHLMCEEIEASHSDDQEISKGEEMDVAYTEKLQAQLVSGSCRAWVVEYKQRIVASGAVSIVMLVPVPRDPGGRIAHIHSIFTDRGYRRRGFAQRIMRELIDFCKSQRIRRIQLRASDDGRPLYEKLGFKPAKGIMSLWLQ